MSFPGIYVSIDPPAAFLSSGTSFLPDNQEGKTDTSPSAASETD